MFTLKAATCCMVLAALARLLNPIFSIVSLSCNRYLINWVLTSLAMLLLTHNKKLMTIMLLTLMVPDYQTTLSLKLYRIISILSATLREIMSAQGIVLLILLGMFSMTALNQFPLNLVTPTLPVQSCSRYLAMQESCFWSLA